MNAPQISPTADQQISSSEGQDAACQNGEAHESDVSDNAPLPIIASFNSEEADLVASLFR